MENSDDVWAVKGQVAADCEIIREEKEEERDSGTAWGKGNHDAAGSVSDDV